MGRHGARGYPGLILMALLAGCAGPLVRVDAPAWQPPLVESLPLRVGVYVSPAQRGYMFVDSSMSGARLDLGEAGAATLLAAARGGFAGAVELDDPAAAAGAGVDAVLSVAAMEWRSTLTREATTTSAHYTLRLAEPSGALVGEWTREFSTSLEEIVPDPGQPGLWSLKGVYAAPATVLLERLGSAFLREFRDEPAIRAWLEARAAYRPALPAPAAGAALAPWARPSGVQVASDAGSDVVRRCVIKGLRRELPERPVVAGPALRQALFPWFSDQPAAAAGAERLRALLALPEARSRLEAIGVGTVVLVSGGTRQDWHGAGFCGAGYGGGGCLGLTWGERDSLIVARIVDLASPAALSESSAHRSGTTVIPMLGIPLPFIPATQSAACHEMAHALARELRAQRPPFASPDRTGP